MDLAANEPGLALGYHTEDFSTSEDIQDLPVRLLIVMIVRKSAADIGGDEPLEAGDDELQEEVAMEAAGEDVVDRAVEHLLL